LLSKGLTAIAQRLGRAADRLGSAVVPVFCAASCVQFQSVQFVAVWFFLVWGESVFAVEMAVFSA
jgi:hypothetical protein